MARIKGWKKVTKMMWRNNRAGINIQIMKSVKIYNVLYSRDYPSGISVVGKSTTMEGANRIAQGFMKKYSVN